MISVDSLTKVYGHRVAAWRVSFEVAAGEVLGFLGPNVNRYHVAELVYASGAKRLAARRKDDATWTASSGTPPRRRWST